MSRAALRGRMQPGFRLACPLSTRPSVSEPQGPVCEVQELPAALSGFVSRNGVICNEDVDVISQPAQTTSENEKGPSDSSLWR